MIKKRGFTLVEVMIVVSIIALIAAISIPNLLRARLTANETAAIASLKAISTACESYSATQTPRSYPESLSILGTEKPPYIDDVLARSEEEPGKQGYIYIYTQVDPNRYTCVAIPYKRYVTGVRSFAVDESGFIREASAGVIPGVAAMMREEEAPGD